MLILAFDDRIVPCLGSENSHRVGEIEVVDSHLKEGSLMPAKPFRAPTWISVPPSAVVVF